MKPPSQNPVSLAAFPGCYCFKLQRVLRAANGGAFSRRGRALGLTTYALLEVLAVQGAQRPTDLAALFESSTAAVTGQVDSLVERGLVERVKIPGGDRRVWRVQATAEGRRFLRELAAEMGWAVGDVMNGGNRKGAESAEDGRAVA